MESLCVGMRATDWAWLCRPGELRSNMYVVDHDGDNFLARHPGSDDETPWYVLRMLGSYSMKHIFGSGRLLAMKEVANACTDMKNRLYWRWHFTKHEKERHQTLDESSLYKRRPLEYRGTVPASVRNFGVAVIREVTDTCKAANAKISRAEARYRRPKFVDKALTWLRDSGWVAVPADKDGTLTLVARERP